MSHKFRKPTPISDARRAVAQANGASGLAASAIVLTTESKEKHAALLAAYLEKCDPDGPIETDLVEEMVAAEWPQRRVAAMMAALLDVEMDCMEKEISDQSEHIDNTVRKVLAFTKQGKESATLALLNRYAARHAREYHRAVRHLREIQSERPRNKKLQNEPKPDPTPESAITSDGETGHRPLVSDRWEGISQNEPKPELTPEPSTTSRLATSHKPPATEFSPLATRHSSLQPARDHESELATSHQPLATEVSPLQPTEGNNATRIL